MSPLFAWVGAVLGLLLALMTGFPPGALTSPALGATAPGCGQRPAARRSRGGRTSRAASGGVDPDTSFARSILASVVSAGDSAWAIGLTTESEDPRFPLAVRWDGHAWVDMPIAPSPAERALFGLDRSPSGRLWAAGYRAKSSLYYPMMMRWDGSRWIVSSLGAAGQPRRRAPERARPDAMR